MFWVLGQVELHVLIRQFHEGVGSRGSGHLQICCWQAHQDARPVMQAGQEQAHALRDAPVLEAFLGRLNPTQMWHLQTLKDSCHPSQHGHHSAWSQQLQLHVSNR